MKQQATYPDRTINSSYVPNFIGRLDSFSAETENQYKISQVEKDWQRDRDISNVQTQMPSRVINEGQRGALSRSYYQGEASDLKLGLENQINKESISQSLEQDMEVGYEDNASPLTFEGLERKFHDDTMKLVKEHYDAEDAENTRHREKIGGINNGFQEKLSALRAYQASRRRDLLQKESQERASKYQHTRVRPYPTVGMKESHSSSVALPDRAYTSDHFDSRQERAHYPRSSRTQETEERVPYPEGRVYNNTGTRY